MEIKENTPNPLKEIFQPIVDWIHAPRALWGINISYLLEGMVYFGMIGLLAMYFNKYIGLNDVEAGWMVGVLSWGITFSMFFFGGLADRWGIRAALILSLILMLIGRIVLVTGVAIGLSPDGLFSPLHLMAMGGILFIVLGYGMYQPAAYSAVRNFTTPKTASMGYGMLYAVMNLGGWLPTFVSPPVRKRFGIVGVYKVFSGSTVFCLILTILILSKRTIEKAVAAAKAAADPNAKKDENLSKESKQEIKKPASFSFLSWLKNHPLANAKFSFFIFALIPVQTLFAYNWLILPQYVERAFRGTWIGDNFEAATNFNPILIFFLVPLVTAVTQKAKVYHMMIIGTFVMATPTFLLALGPTFWTLLGYLVLMTIGEAMWQPRFLQYAAEIAPEGRTGAYMGVAQFPWFLTKMITSLYTGWFLTRYCPQKGELHTETMWLIFASIAILSTILLVLAKGWLGKDFKTKSI